MKDFTIKGSSVFGDYGTTKCDNDGSSDIMSFYDECILKLSNNPNWDCSEIAEDFLSRFGGSVILILHRNYNSWKTFDVKKSNGDITEYVYHYAYLSDNNEVFDPLLGYSKIDRVGYLNMTCVLELNNESDINIEILRGCKFLKTYP